MRIAVMMQLPVETEKARPSHAHYCTPGAYGDAKKKAKPTITEDASEVEGQRAAPSCARSPSCVSPGGEQRDLALRESLDRGT